MNAKDFDKIATARMDWCMKTLCAKGDEYARGGDRLWNFKVAARMLNCHPAEALAGMMVKHTVSVDDIIDGLARCIVPPRWLVAEKIGDSINYLLLLEGLIEEARGEVQSRQTAVREQDTRRREQAATSAQRREAMDALASACGCPGPLPEDGDDDHPVVVHNVPDKTSRSTLPPGCLGRLCGRGDDEWRPCPEDAL